MAADYIRRHDGSMPRKGWSLVQFPDFENEPAVTYEVCEPLATEMRRLIGIGSTKQARTLLFWFDTEGLTDGP